MKISGPRNTEEGGIAARNREFRSRLNFVRLHWKIFGLYSIILAFFAVFFILPVAIAVRSGFVDQTGSLTFAYLREVFRNPLYLEGFLNALKIAIGSTLAAFLLASPLAWVGYRFDFPGKSALSALLILPVMLPPFVGAIGFRQILGQEGALNALLHSIGLLGTDRVIDWLGTSREWGIVLLNALHLYPILYLNLVASLSNVDTTLLEAAEMFGCSGLRRAARVTLPLILPGIFSGGSIVFIWAFTELGVPLMFDYYRVTPVQIFDGIQDIDNNPMTYALVAVTLAATALIYFVVRIFIGSPPALMPVRGGHGRNITAVSGLRGLACSMLFLSICGFALLPQLGVLCVSFSKDWYRSIFPNAFTLDHYIFALGNHLTVPAIQNSLLYASLSTCVDLFLGVAIAYLVTRTLIPGRSWLDSLAMLPLAVPGLVLAFGYLALTRRGSFFSFLAPVQNPLVLLVLTYAVRRLPYVVRSAAAGFQQAGISLEEAAQSVGAAPFRALRRITLPLIAGHLFSGALLAFAFAVLEVSDSLVLAQKQADYPIAKAIYELSNVLGEGPYLAAALGVWAMVFLGLATAAARVAAGRGGTFAVFE
ncbi:MAG TPA: iron ABC transporter permease [Chthoniobacterales bacterium]|jgi:iron(III) transport system permease protein|nr:iron ABC transporter permease [Chthoniobacterales bacterium]